MPPDLSPQAVEESEWMTAISRGDAGAFERLYHRHSPQLYGICLKVLRQPADAQAVLSDVFMDVWKRADRFNPQRGSVRSYLVTLARSRAIDRLRSEGTRHTHERNHQALAASGQPTPATNPEATAIFGEHQQLVRQAMGSLSGPQRATLEMAYFRGLTHREIADELNIPLGTAKTHIRTALKKLRSTLASLGGLTQ